PGAGRRVKVEIQGQQGNSTLTRRPATYNRNRIRAHDRRDCASEMKRLEFGVAPKFAIEHD
ncbi:MAG: hypothetical protein ACREDS_04440, partial [Limisphaerales bacterium]